MIPIRPGVIVPEPAYTTRLGQCWNTNALEGLALLADDSVDLVLTSPPFALRRRKAYGNVEPADYTAWLWPYIEQIHRVVLFWNWAVLGTEVQAHDRFISINC